MDRVNLFDIAAQQSRWLGVRQAAIAGNIANVNTPNYGTAEVEPFQKVLDKTRVAMTATSSSHLLGNATEAGFKVSHEDTSASVLKSKNTVVLENELMKAGEVRRDFEMNTAITKAFHRMMMLSVKA